MSMSLGTALRVASASLAQVLAGPLLKVLHIVFVRLLVPFVHDFPVFLLSSLVPLLIEPFLSDELRVR